MSEPTRNVLLLVQYDGTDFAGWQHQPGLRTVQGVLGEAVRAMVHHDVTLYGSSRTDAGVHARAMPVNFETHRTIPAEGFLRGLNGHLPPDAAVVEARDVPAGFRARDAAVAKTYRYLFQTGPCALPLHRRTAWWVRRRALDLGAMRDAAQRLVGEHDFAAFRSSSCVSKTTMRRMYRLDLTELGADGLLALDITGNAFLHNMVRVIAGTLAEVGWGQRAPESLDALLSAGARAAAGVTAPAHGLTLVQVHFEGYPRLGKRPRPDDAPAPEPA